MNQVTESPTTLAESLLEEFEREVKTTRKFLERVPEDKLAWQPHPKSMTAGQLALHIAQTPAGVLEMGMQDEAPPPDLSVREQPARLREVLDALDRSAEQVRRILPTLSDERMNEIFTVVQGSRTLMALPRIAFLRSIMLNQWYHHRGQLGVYLQLLGVKVPSSYGPSGDEGVPGME